MKENIIKIKQLKDFNYNFYHIIFLKISSDILLFNKWYFLCLNIKLQSEIENICNNK
jgi:hypothetical protein